MRMDRLPLALALGLVLGGPAWAQSEAPQAEERATRAEAREHARAAEVSRRGSEEARAEAMAKAAEAHEKALRTAESEQRQALEAVEAARREMEAHLARQQEQAERQSEQSEAQRAEAARRAEETQDAALRELERAYDSMRRATREVSRVHRDLNRRHRPTAPRVTSAYAYQVSEGDDPVIGVILGSSSGDGVELLGVSPDGPADRAGIQQGDIIISMMGEDLATDGENPREVLHEVMEDVEVGDELVITVERQGDLHEYTVTAEKREPYTWHSYRRLPSVPHAPGAPSVVMDTIVVPQIDRESLDTEIAEVREQLDRTRIVINRRDNYSVVTEDDYSVEFDEFSAFGDAVLAETNVWFGLPMTQGLKMAELDEGLGEYFDTDRGVLVLKARDDNVLDLQSGDVILSVGGTDVGKPSDVMRALRGFETGDTVDIEIMRDRQSETLNFEVPERSEFGFLDAPGMEFHYRWPPDVDVEVHPESHGDH